MGLLNPLTCFINIGDKVNVRLSGSHALYFNSIDGIIKNISPDAIHNRTNNNTYYQVFIELKDNKFISSNKSYKVLPGLDVVANIIIGKRSIISNLLAPFNKSFNKSLNENIWYFN